MRVLYLKQQVCS